MFETRSTYSIPESYVGPIGPISEIGDGGSTFWDGGSRYQETIYTENERSVADFAMPTLEVTWRPSQILIKAVMSFITIMEAYITWAIGEENTKQGVIICRYELLIYGMAIVYIADFLICLRYASDSPTYISMSEKINIAHILILVGLIFSLNAYSWGASGEVALLLQCVIRFQVIATVLLVGIGKAERGILSFIKGLVDFAESVLDVILAGIAASVTYIILLFYDCFLAILSPIIGTCADVYSRRNNDRHHSGGRGGDKSRMYSRASDMYGSNGYAGSVNGSVSSGYRNKSSTVGGGGGGGGYSDNTPPKGKRG